MFSKQYVWNTTENDWDKYSNSIYYYDENQLSVNDKILGESLKLYPNPVNDILTIESKNVTVSKVEIYSILGKKIKDIHSRFKTIRTDNLSNGLYLIKIYSEKGMVMKKIYKR